MTCTFGRRCERWRLPNPVKLAERLDQRRLSVACETTIGNIAVPGSGSLSTASATHDDRREASACRCA